MMSYTTPQPIYAALLQANPKAYNMSDPADLPPHTHIRVRQHGLLSMRHIAEQQPQIFEFAHSTLRMQPPSPIHALHAKVFRNYMKWCRDQGVMPHYSRMSTSAQAGMAGPPSVASRVVDLVLFFCIWGEGGQYLSLARAHVVFVSQDDGGVQQRGDYGRCGSGQSQL
jgi:hypothetical protein